jgi:hypothetical protein
VTERPCARRLAGVLLGAALAPGISALPVQAGALTAPEWSAHGFGTLGVVRSDQEHADVVSSVYLQPDGAGRTRTWHMGVDSKIGGQLDLRFAPQLSAVVQVVSKHRYDSSWKPEVEWANVKYAPLPGLSMRAGRTVAPFFMYSDTANVGYANLWVRGPQELYGAVPVTHLDGVDLAWNAALGAVTNVFQASFGRNRFDAVGGVEITGENAWLLSDTVEVADVTLRAGYLAVDLTFDAGDLDTLIGGLASFAPALARRYAMDDTPLEMYTLGVRAKRGAWLLLGEWARLSDTGILPKTNIWYVTVGRQFRAVTPYLTVGHLESDTPAPAASQAPGLPPPLAGGLDAALRQAAPSQSSVTAGVRWDFHASAALKFEYQHARLEDHSAGRLGNLRPGFAPGGDTDAFSVALDFVF